MWVIKQWTLRSVQNGFNETRNWFNLVTEETWSCRDLIHYLTVSYRKPTFVRHCKKIEFSQFKLSRFKTLNTYNIDRLHKVSPTCCQLVYRKHLLIVCTWLLLKVLRLQRQRWHSTFTDSTTKRCLRTKIVTLSSHWIRMRKKNFKKNIRRQRVGLFRCFLSVGRCCRRQDLLGLFFTKRNTMRRLSGRW